MQVNWTDIKVAFRSLRKNLSVTWIATGSLALAVAGNTAVYSLVNSFLNRPLPYNEVNRLVFLSEPPASRTGEPAPIAPLSRANYLDLVEAQHSLSDLAAYRGTTCNLIRNGSIAQLSAGLVTPNFFRVLGASPAYGRLFTAGESSPGWNRVAILSYSFWTREFGSRPDAIGSTIRLNGESYQIVGVAAKSFEWYLALKTDVWMPLVMTRSA